MSTSEPYCDLGSMNPFPMARPTRSTGEDLPAFRMASAVYGMLKKEEFGQNEAAEKEMQSQ